MSGENADSLEVASLKVSGMTCADCSARVEDFLARLPAVKKFNVSLLAEKVKIQFNSSHSSLSDISAGIEKLGFTTSPLSEGSAAVLRLLIDRSAAPAAGDSLRTVPGVVAVEVDAPSSSSSLVDWGARSCCCCLRSRSAHNDSRMLAVTYDPEVIGARSVFRDAQVAAARSLGLPPTATATFPGAGQLPPGRPIPLVAMLDAASSASAVSASSASGQLSMATRLYVGIAAGIASTVLAYAVPKQGGPGPAGSGIDVELAPQLTPRVLVQLILATIVLAVVGAPIAASAWAAAVQSRMMTMDTLVTASSGAAYLFSVGMLIAACAGVPAASLSEPIFETTVVLLALVMVGRAIEHAAKKRTGAALARLTALAAEDAQLVASADAPVPSAAAAASAGSAAAAARSGGSGCCGSEPSSASGGCGISSGAGAVPTATACTSAPSSCCDAPTKAAASGCCAAPAVAPSSVSCCAEKVTPAAAADGCCTATLPSVTPSSCCTTAPTAAARCATTTSSSTPACCSAASIAPALPTACLSLPMTISPALLHLGDVVTVPPRARFPADGLLTSGLTTADESAVTGESLPVPKAAGDVVIGGTVNGDGVVSVRITALPGSGAVSRIVALIEEVQGQKPAVQRTADVVAGYFTPAIFATAIAAWVLWFILASKGVVTPPGGTPPGAFALLFALTLLVVSCPCAISLAVPTAVMVATQVGARMGALIKGGPCLESLAGVTAVVLDKTGTVTAGTPAIAEIYLAGPPRMVAAAVKSAGLSVDAAPAAPTSAAAMMAKLPLGMKLGSGELALLAAAAFAEKGSQHPLARAVVSLADANCTTTLRSRPGPSATAPAAGAGCSSSGGSDDGAERTTLPGLGVACQLPGAPPSASASGALIHVGALSYVLGPAVSATVEDGDEDDLADAAAAMQSKGMSVVAVSVSRAVIGLLGFRDHLRPSAAAAVADLHARGISVWLASGDNQGAVDAAARELGIPPLFARGGLSPADKAALVRGVQRRTLHASAAPAVAEAAAARGGVETSAALAAGAAEAGAASALTPRGRYLAAVAAAGAVTPGGFIEFDAVDALATRQRAAYAARNGYCSSRAWSAFFCGGSGDSAGCCSNQASPSLAAKSETTALLAAAHGTHSSNGVAAAQAASNSTAGDSDSNPFAPLLECSAGSQAEISAARKALAVRSSPNMCSSIGAVFAALFCCCRRSRRRSGYTAIAPGSAPAAGSATATAVAGSDPAAGAPATTVTASRVLFAGDGINDAVALAQADVAVALGSGTAIAIDAADVVIMHNDLTVLGGLLDLSAATLQRIRTNFAWAAVYNAIAMPLAGGALYPFIHALAIPPALAGISELLSSVPVVVGSLLLFRWAPAAHVGKGA